MGIIIYLHLPPFTPTDAACVAALARRLAVATGKPVVADLPRPERADLPPCVYEEPTCAECGETLTSANAAPCETVCLDCELVVY